MVLVADRDRVIGTSVGSSPGINFYEIKFLLDLLQLNNKVLLLDMPCSVRVVLRLISHRDNLSFWYVSHVCYQKISIAVMNYLD